MITCSMFCFLSQTPRNLKALVQFTESAEFQKFQAKLGLTHSKVKPKLYHFSENEELNMREVDGPINDAEENREQGHALVLLQATGDSSYLYFDPSHYPRNVDLCKTLKKRLGGRITFVFLPTGQKEDSLASSGDQVQQICDDFLSARAHVIQWNGFDSRRSVNTGAVKSLIADKTAVGHQKAHRAWKTGSPSPCSIPWALFWALLIGFLASWCVLWRRESFSSLLSSTSSETKLGKESRVLPDENQAAAEKRKKIHKIKQAAVAQKKANEEESDRLSQRKDGLDEENQTLSKEAKRLDEEEQAVAMKQKANEKQSKRLHQDMKMIDEKNQTLAEKAVRIDEEQQAVVVKRKANEEESGRLRLRKQRLDKENQTLAEKAKQIDKEEQAAQQQRSLLMRIMIGVVVVGGVLVAALSRRGGISRQDEACSTPKQSGFGLSEAEQQEKDLPQEAATQVSLQAELGRKDDMGTNYVPYAVKRFKQALKYLKWHMDRILPKELNKGPSQEVCRPCPPCSMESGDARAVRGLLPRLAEVPPVESAVSGVSLSQPKPVVAEPVMS